MNREAIKNNDIRVRDPACCSLRNCNCIMILYVLHDVIYYMIHDTIYNMSINQSIKSSKRHTSTRKAPHEIYVIYDFVLFTRIAQCAVLFVGACALLCFVFCVCVWEGHTNNSIYGSVLLVSSLATRAGAALALAPAG